MFSEISQNSQENTCAREFWELSKNTFFTEHLWANASEHTSLQYTKNTGHVKSSVTAQKMKFSIKYFFSKCDQICRKLDLFTFTEEILKGKLYFLCSEWLLIPMGETRYQEKKKWFRIKRITTIKQKLIEIDWTERKWWWNFTIGGRRRTYNGQQTCVKVFRLAASYK